VIGTRVVDDMHCPQITITKAASELLVSSMADAEIRFDMSRGPPTAAIASRCCSLLPNIERWRRPRV